MKTYLLSDDGKSFWSIELDSEHKQYVFRFGEMEGESHALQLHWNGDTDLFYDRQVDAQLRQGYDYADEELLDDLEALEINQIQQPADIQAVERAIFPSGAWLSEYSSEENERGTMLIPLPFEGEDRLVLHWEKIVAPAPHPSLAFKWGRALYSDTQQCYFWGRFTYNDEPFQASSNAPESFHECRFDVNGSDAIRETCQDFDGNHGYNVSKLMDVLLEKTSDGSTPFSVEDNGKADLLDWNASGNSAVLALREFGPSEDEEILPDGDLYFRFKFAENTLCYEYVFSPTDIWNGND
ncbi:MAG: hypothetical protein H6727_20935 [Myxococcales bacterium]|nr:hypothetical protein [Myxococcales bacterium]